MPTCWAPWPGNRKAILGMVVRGPMFVASCRKTPSSQRSAAQFTRYGQRTTDTDHGLSLRLFRLHHPASHVVATIRADHVRRHFVAALGTGLKLLGLLCV